MQAVKAMYFAAAALEATANVLSNFNACGEFFNRIISVVGSYQEEKSQNEAKLLDLKDDLWKLKTTMPKMLDLIERVEWQSHKDAAARLLPDIKDAVYDAEDLLDEFNYYALKMKVEESRNSGQDHLHAAFMEFYKNLKLNNHFSKVKGIQSKLDHMHSQSKDLGLHEAPQKFDRSIRPHSMPNTVEKKIFGRKNQLKELVEMLGVPRRKRGRSEAGRLPESRGCGGERSDRSLETPDNNGEGEARMIELGQLAVLPIVGMGGVGKTTMAQQICDDANVKKHFGRHIIWTCVSDDFDIKRLTKEILEQLGQGTSSDNPIILTKKLSSCLKSKRFLLVLDDIWGDILERDAEEWKNFYAALVGNASQGSKILVTTRFPNVAKLVSSVKVEVCNNDDTAKDYYELKGLKNDVLLDFFKQCAFGSDSSGNHPELELIARGILPKLKGSPLAAKTLGRLLQRDLNKEKWEKILQSELWQIKQEKTDILPALRLSYMYLPQDMKRCFSICALYPKDHKFDEKFLVNFWIAQGFVEPQDASFCFDDLVRRSFFQLAPHCRDKYVIHDLLHDMAQLVSKEECFVIKHESDLAKVPSNVRHLSIFTNRNVNCSELKRISSKKKLRSLVCDESYSKPKEFAAIIDCWFKELLEIRVLSFKLSKVRVLPESIGNLKHLRYLALFGSSTFETLPLSVSCLYHLRIVDAQDCVFKRYPQSFSDLVCLKKFKSKCLTYKKDNSGRLCLRWKGHDKHFPVEKQIELLPHCNLQQLRIESYEGKSCPKWLRLDFLKGLTSLELYQCNQIPMVSFFEPFSRHSEESDDLYHLEMLNIQYCPEIDWQSLVSLPSSLTKIILCDFGHPADHFVRCFHGLNHLTNLSIECSSLTSIPLDVWSRNLPSLENLHIEYCSSLTSIGAPEASISSSSSSNVGAFSSLASVTIAHCGALLSLDEFLTSVYLPVVKRISVGYCEELTSLPVDRLHGFSCLEDLNIEDCFKLNTQRIMTLPSSLKKLNLWYCPTIECIDNRQLGRYPTLESVRIVSCPDVRSIDGAIAVAQIEEVSINNCPNLTDIEQPFYKPAT